MAANTIWQFSSLQRQLGPHPGECLSGAHWATVTSQLSDCCCWTLARVPCGDAAYRVPTALAWLPNDALPGSTSGLAAGETRADAERSALLELVERDAVAIWWYNQCPRPPVPLATLDEAGGADLRRWLQQRSRRTHLLDLTHDLRIPVVAAVSSDPDGGNIAYAFAAKMKPAEAALSATLEMLQAELSLRMATQREALVGRPEGPAGRFLVWSRTHRLDRLPHLLPHDAAPAVAPESADADPIAIVERRGPHPVLFVDLDQPDDPLRVVRAIVPGLRPWRPRFAPGRLFDVPRALGWPHTPIVEEQVGEDDVILI